MDELLNQIGLPQNEAFSAINYIINIIICSILLSLLSLLYVRFGKSLSNRSQLSKVLIVVGLTTFIIISIVKSSLALSLGLVGALSIVRFRTAIKEPEELGYFFIAIALGLGMGADQLWPTLIGFIMLGIIVIILNKRNIGTSITQNLLISLPSTAAEKGVITKQLSDIVADHANQVDLKRIKLSENHISVNYLINIKSLEQINNLNNALLEVDPKMDLTFIDSEI